jgi:hypothetical protein
MSWWAPVVIVKSDKLDFANTTPTVWMKDRKELNVGGMPDKDHFIIVNPEEIGE